MAILNRYKDTLNNFIDSSDPKYSDWPEQIEKKSGNAPRSAGSSTRLLDRICLDKNVSNCLSV